MLVVVQCAEVEYATLEHMDFIVPPGAHLAGVQLGAGPTRTRTKAGAWLIVTPTALVSCTGGDRGFRASIISSQGR